MARLRLPFEIPYPHFMAFAPLDAWARMLLGPGGRVGVRYWPRLAFGLFTSVLATALTLPERLALWPVLALVWRRRGEGEGTGGAGGGAGVARRRLEHGPGVVLILGYYRTGTTHLHYLMSCDPRLRAPAWCETLAPQGFALSWAFLRVFMIPFVSAQRPQDDVAIGPSWPAEDDFAVNNWGLASSLPGRFVLPRAHAFYDRFHSLEGLSPAELSRWRRAQLGFVWKIAKLAGGRPVLLKTPSHTARLGELRRLFCGPMGGRAGGQAGGRVKVVHISREPGAVIRSNVSMASRLSVYNLQRPDPGDDVAGRIRAEYLETERRYCDAAAELPAGDLVEIRYEDLVADPMGQLKLIYTTLGLEWTREFEERALGYLNSVRDYRAATPARKGGENGAIGAEADPEVRALAERFGHDRPAVEAKDLPTGTAADGRCGGRAAAVALVAAAACAALWIGQAWLLHNRHDWLVWPAGVLIGAATIRSARVGSDRLGAWAGALTLLVFVLVALPGTFLSDYWPRPDYQSGARAFKDWEWYHILKATRVGLLSWNNVFWGFMGSVTAFRFASRRYVRPPGRG